MRQALVRTLGVYRFIKPIIIGKATLGNKKIKFIDDVALFTFAHATGLQHDFAHFAPIHMPCQYSNQIAAGIHNRGTHMHHQLLCGKRVIDIIDKGAFLPLFKKVSVFPE